MNLKYKIFYIIAFLEFAVASYYVICFTFVYHGITGKWLIGSFTSLAMGQIIQIGLPFGAYICHLIAVKWKSL